MSLCNGVKNSVCICIIFYGIYIWKVSVAMCAGRRSTLLLGMRGMLALIQSRLFILYVVAECRRKILKMVFLVAVSRSILIKEIIFSIEILKTAAIECEAEYVIVVKSLRRKSISFEIIRIWTLLFLYGASIIVMTLS